MNIEQFKNFIGNLPPQPISVTTVTRPKMNKQHKRHKELYSILGVKSLVNFHRLDPCARNLFIACNFSEERSIDLLKLCNDVENPHYDKVECVAKRLGFIGVSYEDATNNKRCREAEEGTVPETFNVGKLWHGNGEHVSKNIVRHIPSGEEYLVFYPRQKTDRVIVSWREYRRTDNGQPIEPKSLEPYWQPEEPSATVNWRIVKLVNLIEVTLDNRTIEIEHSAPMRKAA